MIVADDLPLNVSRETLQSSTFLKQLKSIILKRIIQLFEKLAREDEARFAVLQEVYGNVLKLGAVEDVANREKLTAMARFDTNHRNFTSLDQVRLFHLDVAIFVLICACSIWKIRNKGRSR